MERQKNELRPIKIVRKFLKDPEGSALIEMGNTKVLCTATVQDKVPNWLRGSGQGWLSAEYAMIPRATPERKVRESRVGKPDSRSIEISRIIGRSLRGILDLTKLDNFTIIIDCDVLQADGGTRTAAINAGFCALYDAIRYMLKNRLIKENPIKEYIGAVSVGIVDGEYVLDLSYEEDVRAEVDMNVSMTESGRIVDIQGTGEKRPLTKDELNKLLNLAWEGIKKIIQYEKEVLTYE